MLKIVLQDPVNSESDHDICWHNLAIADKYHNLQLFIAAARAWCRLNPDKNYQDLEKVLRGRALNTYIIASQDKIPANADILFCNGSNQQTPCQYHAVFSCRPNPHALQELLKHWNSYDENFDKLRNTGDICLKDRNTVDTNIRNFSEKEIDLSTIIINNRKKVIIQEQNIDKYLKELDNWCIAEFNKKCTQKLLAMAPDGAHIFVFVVDGQIVSEYGLSIKHDDNGEHKELVDLNLS